MPGGHPARSACSPVTPPGTCAPGLTATGVEMQPLLTHGTLTVVGRVRDASNATLIARAHRDAQHLDCVYKPLAGERPLWDFPDNDLAMRECLTYAFSEAIGCARVPPTVWRSDAPAGPGMVQQWVAECADDEQPPVTLVTDREPPAGYLAVLRARDERGRSVLLVHRDEPDLAAIAVLDVLANNADRKGGHLLRDDAGSVWAIDHGLTWHPEPKLRTVLWGWAGQPLTTAQQRLARQAATVLAGDFGIRLADGLGVPAREAARERAEMLLDTGVMPLPDADSPIVPWPVF